MNKFGIDFLKKIDMKNKYSDNNLIENKENEFFINTNHIQSVNKILERFFDSVFLDEKHETHQYFQKGTTSLSQIIKEKMSSKNVLDNMFVKVGVFSSDDEKYNDQHIFEVYIRKPNINDEIFEILIYDISSIKLIEKTKAEGRYKQKILAKIAHEFKTPLITITTIINSLNDVKDIGKLEAGTKKKLSHVMNLSNYTLYLIQDIIEYVSEETRIKVSLSKVKVKENLKFCYDVLQTLIDCNEKKSYKIKTSFQYDDEIENLTILSDENKLKQIFLNLISNSIKFTVSGSIKLLASFDFINNALVISVEDTGIGIKEEDFHLIFQENIQLNLDKDYNSKGSGLGLAISKQIAISLNYQMDFDSKLGKGTKFNLKIPLTNHLNQTYEKISEESVNKTIKFKYSHNFPKLSTSLINQDKIPTKQFSSISLSKKFTRIVDSHLSEKNNSKENLKNGKNYNLLQQIMDLSFFNYNFTIT